MVLKLLVSLSLLWKAIFLTHQGFSATIEKEQNTVPRRLLHFKIKGSVNRTGPIMMLNIHGQDFLRASKSKNREKVRSYFKEAFGLKPLNVA